VRTGCAISPPWTNKSACVRCDFSKLILICSASLHVGVHIENDRNIKLQFPKKLPKEREKMARVSQDRRARSQSRIQRPNISNRSIGVARLVRFLMAHCLANTKVARPRFSHDTRPVPHARERYFENHNMISAVD
jgi:hypothetical protein